jgi:CRP-like cAMP-binding protein
LVFVLQGLLGIRAEALGDSTLIHLGPGEILGEMSLLEGEPASATILAVEDSLLLVLPVDILRRELDGNPHLAARFYRALGRIVSGRLRDSMGRLGQVLGEGGRSPVAASSRKPPGSSPVGGGRHPGPDRSARFSRWCSSPPPPAPVPLSPSPVAARLAPCPPYRDRR